MIHKSNKHIFLIFSFLFSINANAGDSLFIKSLKSYVKIITPIENFLIVKQNKLYGLADSSGKLIAPIKSDSFKIGFRSLQLNGMWGVVSGVKIIVDFICDSVNIGDGAGVIYKGGKCGIVNDMTPFLSPIIYDSTNLSYSMSIIPAYVNAKIDIYLLYDAKPKKLNKIPFDEVKVVHVDKSINQEYLYVKRNGKWGIISDSGKIIVKIKHSDLDEVKRIFALWNK